MTTKTRILLVDDEPQIVQAMQRICRSRRDRWDVRTATSARSALEMLEAEPADIVVSDMRMPGMDGAAFLAAVKESYPAAIRIVLSGQASSDESGRAAIVADKILAKPFDTTSLLGMLEGAAAEL
ncbi:MAG: response regulator receiver modulated metal dependent phosphohydrolase [Labilithrix sp.]|nr:response regulator receiver modulated metal dependent phosphohydrolase [Labilithrix sp.]